MLQQTRVETVVPYYERFVAAMPTVHALAHASIDRVLELWSGLGYYRRARLLHRGAMEVSEKYDGVLPRDPRSLASIAGIGRYTAGAIASIAHGVQAPIVDGNVSRVLSRLEALEDVTSPSGKKKLWVLAERLVQGDGPGELNQALMELGATVCTPKNPSCESCPLVDECKARARGIERTLPRAARKRPPKTVSLRAFVVEVGDAIVCGKRKPDALYGGMWEPPMLGLEDDLAGCLGVTLATCRPRGQFTHVLTHRRLEVDVFHVCRATKAPKPSPFGEYECFDLVRRDALASLAMSRLARRALATALASEGGRKTHFRSL